MTSAAALKVSGSSLRKMLVPLALAQFICSFAGSNMNVMISDISRDLHTTVQGVQVCITLFLLLMAALMIPCGKLTDRYGRKRLFQLGLLVYGVGAVISAASPGLGVLILGNSVFEGVGTALLIPPVYILTTMLFRDVKSRVRAFGVISGMGGIGAATGPLIGGAITTAISWRAAFVFQALVIVVIVLLGRSLVDPVPADTTRPFDTIGAVLSAVGLVVLVGGIMAADKNVALMAVLLVAGALILAGFFAWIHHRERAGKEALLSTGLFRNRTSNLALVTQNVQWQVLLGSSFVVSVYLQTVRHYDAIQTGVIFTAATVGILLSSLAAGRLVRWFKQRTLILAGFVITIVGIIVLLIQVKGHPGAWYFAPGLFLIGVGVGTMLTPSVNVVQSAFPEKLQGEISGLSRSVSNLGSSIGTAIAGTILVAGLNDGQRSYGIAMAVLAFIALLGLAATVMLPRTEPSPRTGPPSSEPAAPESHAAPNTGPLPSPPRLHPCQAGSITVSGMRFATIRTAAGTTAARLDEDTLVPLDAADVGELLSSGDAASVPVRSGAAVVPVAEADFAPVVTNPSKIVCVGLNYRTHIIETGRDLPEYPTLFAKFAETLMGPNDDLAIPAVSEKVDWEVELAVIIGTPVYRASAAQALSAIAGYATSNDVSMRDWQRRTLQWLAGKMFQHTTPVGPYLVTPDEVDHAADLEVRSEVDGEIMQQARTSDLLFKPADVVAYVSQAITLNPGDLLLTGTTGGVGDARKPPLYLKPGQVLRSYVEGVGECVNHCVAEKPAQ